MRLLVGVLHAPSQALACPGQQGMESDGTRLEGGRYLWGWSRCLLLLAPLVTPAC